MLSINGRLLDDDLGYAMMMLYDDVMWADAKQTFSF
jgi:hypothetical protein